jgi:hypothetical protein
LVQSARGVHRAPRNLIRQFIDDGGGIEFGGRSDADHAGQRQRRHEISPKTDFRLHGSSLLPVSCVRMRLTLVVGAMLAGVVPARQAMRVHA